MADEKIGAGHLGGMVRKGFKELGPALKAFPDSMHSPEEPGVFGNLTPQEIVDGKGKESAYDEWLNSRAQELAASEPERDEMGLER